MKEIKFKTSKGEFVVVDMQQGTNELQKSLIGVHLESYKTKINLSEITEKQASDIVESFKSPGYHLFVDYEDKKRRLFFSTSIESLHSLLKSKGIHLFQNPVPEPEHQFDNFGNGGMCENWIKEYQEQESKTFYNPYIFKLND